MPGLRPISGRPTRGWPHFAVVNGAYQTVKRPLRKGFIYVDVSTVRPSCPRTYTTTVVEGGDDGSGERRRRWWREEASCQAWNPRRKNHVGKSVMVPAAVPSKAAAIICYLKITHPNRREPNTAQILIPLTLSRRSTLNDWAVPFLFFGQTPQALSAISDTRCHQRHQRCPILFATNETRIHLEVPAVSRQCTFIFARITTRYLTSHLERRLYINARQRRILSN